MRTIRPILLVPVILGLLASFSGCKQGKDHYTRGVGIYPGDPSEDCSPILVVDRRNYRNIARLRPAYHSSSYDYNLTAQLITDGIIMDEIPTCISLATSEGVLPKNEREWLLDHNPVTEVNIPGADIWLQLDIEGNDVPEITSISLSGRMAYEDGRQGGWKFACSGSDDGITWYELGKALGSGLPGQERPNPFARFFAGTGTQNARRRPANPFAGFFAGPYGSDSTAPRPSFTFNFRMPQKERIIAQSFEFDKPVAYHHYRVGLSVPSADNWRFGDFDFFNHETRLKMAPSHHFKSAWMSAGTGDEWVYVDLGVSSTFDHIRLYWINKATRGSIQVSEDAISWNDLV
jgi:hypothetical protein